MNIFKDAEKAETLRVQINKLGFDVEYKENESCIVATLSKTERFKGGFDLEVWQNKFKELVTPLLSSSKNIVVNYNF